MTQLGTKVPQPTFDALTPPQGGPGIVNFPGPDGITPLMVASMSSATETGHCSLMNGHGQAAAHCAPYKSSTIIPDLIAEGASTEDRTDFYGAYHSHTII